MLRCTNTGYLLLCQSGFCPPVVKLITGCFVLVCLLANYLLKHCTDLMKILEGNPEIYIYNLLNLDVKPFQDGCQSQVNLGIINS